MRLIHEKFPAIMIVVASAWIAEAAAAQMPGTPVLQNAFANPGITAGLDVANLGGTSSYALAGAWAAGSGRFQLSGGIGLQTRSEFPTRTLYGARVNVPVYGAASSLGASLFVGYGGLTGGEIDSSVTRSLVPIGGTLSYRRILGTSRGLSIYGSPVFQLITRGGGASNTSVFRGAVGLDLGITRAIGLTLGIDFGGKQPEGSGKPSGTAFGAAVSYAIGAGR